MDSATSPRDIDAVETLESNPVCVFSILVGIPLRTQQHVLFLSNRCLSVKEFAVFRDRKWTKPQKGWLIYTLPNFELRFVSC